MKAATTRDARVSFPRRRALPYRRAPGLILVALFLASGLAYPQGAAEKPADLRVRQVARLGNNDSYQTVHELHKTGTLLWLAESPHDSDDESEQAHPNDDVLLHRWDSGSLEKETRVEGFLIDSVEALTGNDSTVWLSSRYGQIYRWGVINDPAPLIAPALVLDVSEKLRRPKMKVKALFWDRGRLWIGTKAGEVFSWEQGSEVVEQKFALDGTPVKALHAKGDVLWVGTHKGVYRLNAGSPSLHLSSQQPFLFNRKTIRAIWETDKALWIGTDADGLYRWDKTRDGQSAQPGEPVCVRLSAADVAEPKCVGSVRALYADRSTLWVGTTSGLFRIDGLDAAWAADIKLLSGEITDTQERVNLEWEIQNYGGHTTPELVYQEVIVNGEPKFKGPEITVNRNNGHFTCSFANPRHPDDLHIQIRARDLHGNWITEEVGPAKRGWLAKTFKGLEAWIGRHGTKWWFIPITTVGTLAFGYLAAICALLLLALYGRRSFSGKPLLLSPVWLIAKATQLLLVAPGLGRRALFLGYKRRLSNLKAIRQASENYFGLPVSINGKIQPYDASGRKQHEMICGELGPGRPVLVVGKGGAGKSTLLARLTGLILRGELKGELDEFIPIHVPAYAYQSDLLQAVTDILRDRDGVNVTKDIIDTQLQSGRFLILFDGLSEVGQEDWRRAAEAVLHTAKSAKYRASRFILTTRPIDAPTDGVSVVELLPLTREVLLILLERYGLGPTRVERIKKQLEFFGDRPLDPLLFTMAIAESESERVSETRADLYARYFQHLLKIQPARGLRDTLAWKGWQDALGHIAQWSLLETGKRGVGLRHNALLNRLGGELDEDGAKENFIHRLSRLYGLNVSSEINLLEIARSAGLLQLEHNWRFTHDTFEEFFAAARLLSLADQNGQRPDLRNWQVREGGLSEVMDFVREMAEPQMPEANSSLGFPPSEKLV